MLTSRTPLGTSKVSYHRAVWTLTVGACISLALVVSAAKQQNLQIVTEEKPESCDEIADVGDEVHVHYTGRLESGQIFDTSRQANRGPLPFVLGQGQVIKGWEQGIKGMCVGEKRKLTIPPHLAYGKQGHPPTIPPDSTLIFQTELVSIQKREGAGDDMLYRILRFVLVPAAIITAIYYIYTRTKKQEPQRKHGRVGGGSGRGGKKKGN